MIALNTLARPSAVLELRPEQVDLQNARINMNPKGRRQTKKRRPIVPITDTLFPFVSDRNVSAFVRWNDVPIKSIKKTFAANVREAGLPKEITPYSLRHTMATELRRRGVPLWEVEGMLGHKRQTTSEKYAHYSPEYLSLGREAIDSYFAELSLDYETPINSYVSVACHRHTAGKLKEEKYTITSRDQMVGVTGIEPVTPTMSMVCNLNFLCFPIYSRVLFYYNYQILGVL